MIDNINNCVTILFELNINVVVRDIIMLYEYNLKISIQDINI